MSGAVPNFVARGSRGDYLAIRGWVVRETGLALCALGLMTLASVALSANRMAWMQRLPPGVWKVLMVAAAALTVRTVLFRPMVGSITRTLLYPRVGYGFWEVNRAREVCLAALSLTLLAVAGGAIVSQRAAWMRLISARAWWALVAFGTVLAMRTLICRPICGQVQALNMPLEQRNPAWDSFPIATIRTLDGTPVQAQLVEGAMNRPFSGEVILFCKGNMDLYDRNPTGDLSSLRAQGYSILHYHPRQYGNTPGTRTQRGDYLDAEALIQWLHAPKEEGGHGVAFDRIHILALSIGTGAGIEMMSRYPLGTSLLAVPFATVEGIARRMLGQSLMGRLLCWSAIRAVRDYAEYNSVGKVPELQTENVTVIEGLDDELMGQEPPREAEQLVAAWSTCRSGLDYLRVPAGHNNALTLARIIQVFVTDELRRRASASH